MAGRVLIFSAAILLLALYGCGGKDTRGVYKTPEEVFEASKTAIQNDDFKTFVQCLAPETIEEAAAMMALDHAKFVAMADDPRLKLKGDLKAVVDMAARHGLTTEAVRAMTKHAPGGLDDEEKTRRSLELVKDKAAFFADVLATSPAKVRAATREAVANSTLKNVRVEDDHAFASISATKEGMETVELVEFRKVDGSWRMIKKGGKQ